MAENNRNEYVGLLREPQNGECDEAFDENEIVEYEEEVDPNIPRILWMGPNEEPYVIPNDPDLHPDDFSQGRRK